MFAACDRRGNVSGLTKMGSGLCLIGKAQRFHLERAVGLWLLGHTAGSGVVLCGPAFPRLSLITFPFSSTKHGLNRMPIF